MPEARLLLTMQRPESAVPAPLFVQHPTLQVSVRGVSLPAALRPNSEGACPRLAFRSAIANFEQHSSLRSPPRQRIEPRPTRHQLLQVYCS